MDKFDVVHYVRSDCETTKLTIFLSRFSPEGQSWPGTMSTTVSKHAEGCARDPCWVQHRKYPTSRRVQVACKSHAGHEQSKVTVHNTRVTSQEGTTPRSSHKKVANRKSNGSRESRNVTQHTTCVIDPVSHR